MVNNQHTTIKLHNACQYNQLYLLGMGISNLIGRFISSTAIVKRVYGRFRYRESIAHRGNQLQSY